MPAKEFLVQTAKQHYRSLLRMSLIFLTRLNRERQTILFRRERTSSKLREGTGRAVGLIEIYDQVTRCIRRINVQVSSGGITIFAARRVRNDHEQTRLIFFSDRVEPVFFAIDFKLHRAGELSELSIPSTFVIGIGFGGL